MLSHTNTTKMKNIIRIYFLALSCLFSCKKNGNSTIIIEAKTKVDTIITNSTTILVTPNENEIEEIKKKHGEDNFYTIDDDANYYISEIINESKGAIHKTQQQKISFPKENFIYNKNESNDQWQILEYKIGNKPKIYSLVSYYSRISTIDKKLNDTDLTYYINNNSYFIRDIDINKDGYKDEVISSSKNTGNDLILFLNDKNNKYKFVLKTYNFSQDGGFVIEDVKPLSNSNEVFVVETYFDGANGYRRSNYIAYQNGNWINTRSIYITSNWQSNPNKEYYCEVKQNINLNDKNLPDKLKQIPEESERDKVCQEKIIGYTPNQLGNSDKIGVAEIKETLNNNPIDNKNIAQYNNTAYYLQQNKAYNESLFLLNEIIKVDPNRVVTWLNIGDSQWELGKLKDAKKSYIQYIYLMKKQNKDLGKIPQRVYERSK